MAQISLQMIMALVLAKRQEIEDAAKKNLLRIDSHSIEENTGDILVVIRIPKNLSESCLKMLKGLL